MRKMIQRFMAFGMCMLLLTISPINVFASTIVVEEQVASEVPTVATAKSSLTLSIKVGQGYVQSSSMIHIGAFSTIKVTGRGNSGLQYRVRLQGTGNSNYLVGYLYADGSTLSKKMWTLPELFLVWNNSRLIKK